MKDETVVKAMLGFETTLKDFCDKLRKKYGKKKVGKRSNSSPTKRRRS